MDIRNAVDSCLRMVSDKARMAGIELRLGIPDDMPKVRADARHIKQVVLNLLSNSIKFTPAGGEISINTELDRNDAVTISIADNGIGIAAEDIPLILEPFGQVADSQTRAHEGTGLGLPLSKSLIELHGGELGVDSEPGKGTPVSIRFPPERTIYTN